MIVIGARNSSNIAYTLAIIIIIKLPPERTPINNKPRSRARRAHPIACRPAPICRSARRTADQPSGQVAKASRSE